MFQGAPKGSWLLQGVPAQGLDISGCPESPSQPSDLPAATPAQMPAAFSVLSSLPADFPTCLWFPDSFPTSGTRNVKSHSHNIVFFYTEGSRLQEMCLLGKKKKRKKVLKCCQWNSYTSYPGLAEPLLTQNTLGSSSPISVWLTHQADPVVGLARNKWTGKLTQNLMGISFKCTYVSLGFTKP